MKYSIHDQAILVDGQPVARIEVLPGELDDARLTDLMSGQPGSWSPRDRFHPRPRPTNSRLGE
jgi:hypothetical protein